VLSMHKSCYLKWSVVINGSRFDIGLIGSFSGPSPSKFLRIPILLSKK
jgi:hypothetical protein